MEWPPATPAACDRAPPPPEAGAYRVTRHQVLKQMYHDSADRRTLRRCLAAKHFSDVVVPMGGIAVGDIAQSIATMTSKLPDWARAPASPGAGRLGPILRPTKEDIAAMEPLPRRYRGATVSPPDPPPGDVLEHLGEGQGWTPRAAAGAPRPAARSVRTKRA